MTKRISALGIIISSSIIALSGCTNVNTTPVDGIITRKYEYTDITPAKYVVLVEYKDNNNSKLIKYDVEESYYKSTEIGDTFDDKYAIGDGVTELDIEE